jgi:hypothetical protein
MKKSGAPIEWIPLQPHFVYAQVLALTRLCENFDVQKSILALAESRVKKSVSL